MVALFPDDCDGGDGGAQHMTAVGCMAGAASKCSYMVLLLAARAKEVVAVLSCLLNIIIKSSRLEKAFKITEHNYQLHLLSIITKL